MTELDMPSLRVDPPSVPVRPLRVLLVCMPWAALDMPSLALSTLVPLVREHPAVASVETLYANLRWSDHVSEQTGGRIGERDFNAITRGDFVGVGEWIFSPALHGTAVAPEQTSFYRLAVERGADLAGPAEMHRLSPQFVRDLACDIVRGGYDVVGLTSTFDQNIPSLALAKEIAALSPSVVTVLGGANCDGTQGAALHRNFPFLDYVVRGEAEQLLPDLLQIIAESRAGLPESAHAERLGRIGGLCWRTETGKSTENAHRAGVVSMLDVPTPDYSDYFTAFGDSHACRHLLPKLPMEGSRGCWWGAKHHCTFCGLNGTTMAFRAKPAQRVLDEVSAAVARHQVLDLLFSDNILDMGYLEHMLPELGRRGWDLRLFFEVKSNLGFEQLRRLADGGVTQVQPGIESLSTRVLSLMRKGVTGWQNVRLLRDCRTLTILPTWNVLFGFPGEVWADYETVVSQFRHLVHLTPPDLSTRILLTRFSPYFTDPELGLVNEGPSKLLSSIYGLPQEELADLLYVFESKAAGLDDAEGERIDRMVHEWRDLHRGARLVALNEGERLRIVDERAPRQPKEHLLESVLECAAYRDLLKGRKADVLGRRLREAGHADAAPERVSELLDAWREAGLIYQDGDNHVALATGLEWS